MTIRILALFALLGFMGSANALRVIGQPERPFEVALSRLTLPPNIGGMVTVRACDECRVSTHRFADGAKFVVDGRELRFDEFLKVVTDVRGSPTTNARTVVGVFVDVNTERITRIAIMLPRR
jgi:hypothetical protein